MWAEQVRQECFPYFMFLTRDTGAQHYFGVPLARAWEIFSSAMRKVSGLGRTVRALSMSTGPGKIQVAGVATIHGEKVFVLRVIQGRNPEWCYKPFFAKYDEKALWLDDLQPAFGEKQFFFQAEYQGMMHEAESQVEVQKVVGL